MPLSSASLTAVTLTRNGSVADLAAAITQAAQGGGDAFHHTGREILLVQNGHDSPQTVTAKSVANNFGTVNTADDKAQAIAAGDIAILGPFDSKKFRDANGLVQLTFSGVTLLTLKLYSVPVES